MKMVIAICVGALAAHYLIPPDIRQALRPIGFTILAGCILFGICEAAFRKT